MPRYLGQHFLNNPDIVNQIIEAANIKENEAVLEIGPGEGILTEKICQKAKKVISIELDDKLRANLERKFDNQSNLEIIFEDILKVNLPKLIDEQQMSHYKVIANIPYYITSKIIRLFLETTHQPDELILMIQKEVAQRIVAPKGQMSILAASVQYYAKAEILFDVTKDNFNPPPKVDSSVIKISNIKEVNPTKDKKFFRVVRAGFCARRKTLINNLSNSFHIDKKDVERILQEAGFLPNTRAQELSVSDWEKLADLF
ncbi:MAG: Ribosomal RNA small subunit methyltransferase A [Candidatus Moranbacteria bacterium GW2011_GWF2_34_56]|nr:MAG: Ribosomal RNA small subunit methyltransferase A [Candidatus Moranbacteria bacterium GW2011_GWF1_34_10]KKP64675.1 MAG: Ribosomal RNA small subunit methyltransferase A [Candidatus Moranbacteria bacterium GW2011_GWF2_34_56]